MNLFVDTSNWNLIIILEDNNKIIDSYISRDTKKVSDIMVDHVQDLLGRNNMNIRDINNLYVTKGPGSYTGVRIALTMARTLKTLNDNYHIFAIDSLLYQAGMNRAVSVLDAHGGKSFVGVYEDGIAIVKPKVIENSELDNLKNEYKEFNVVEDYNDLNFEKNYLDLKPNFVEVENVEGLKPIYLKDAIQN